MLHDDLYFSIELVLNRHSVFSQSGIEVLLSLKKPILIPG